MIRVLVLLMCLSAPALADVQTPHFVKTVTFTSDGQKVNETQVIERATMWILKRSPQYWVKIETFYCDADLEKKDDPIEKLVGKAVARGEVVKRELVARTIPPEKIQVVSLGKSPTSSLCLAKILAGPK